MRILGRRLSRYNRTCFGNKKLLLICCFLLGVGILIIRRIVGDASCERWLPNLQLWFEPSDDSFEFSPLSLPEIKAYSPYRNSLSTPGTFVRELEEIVDPKCFEEIDSNPHMRYSPKDSLTLLDYLRIKEEKNMKKILIWNYGFESKTMDFGFGHEPFERGCCQESRCFITSDTSHILLTEFDAIIFHFYNLNIYRMPQERSPHQRWILFESESPAYNFQNPDVFKGLFNWTMTHRGDSDVPTRYNYIYLRSRHSSSHEEGSIPVDLIKRKTKLVTWFVTHCSTFSNREHYAIELQKYIQVDIYGKCGNMTCPKNKKDDCYEMVEANYKFYLAFENSLCRDYVTEKLFNILRYHIVPVVFGFGDYKLVAPPHSYIDILDFESVEEVAKYLVYLDNNDTAYSEYFRWKESYSVTKSHSLVKSTHFCSLCQRLHSEQEEKTYTELRHWHVKEANCKRLKPLSWTEKLFGVTLKYIM